MNWREYIDERPDVLGGKPVFKGTRLGVQMILEELAHGATEAQLLHSYPTLRPGHLKAAYEYAARVISLDDRLSVPEGAA